MDYFFVSKEQFEEWIQNGELCEWAMVYGEYKGIPKSQVAHAAPSPCVSSLSGTFLCSSFGQVSHVVGTDGYSAEGISNRHSTCVRSSYLSMPNQDLISAAVMLC